MRSQGVILTTRKLACELAQLAEKHKGGDIVVLDVSERHSLIDCFVLVTALNSKHASVIGEEAYLYVKAKGQKPWHREVASDWICCDFADVVVHVFTAKTRDYYDFESLWADAEKIAWDIPAPADSLSA